MAGWTPWVSFNDVFLRFGHSIAVMSLCSFTAAAAIFFLWPDIIDKHLLHWSRCMLGWPEPGPFYLFSSDFFPLSCLLSILKVYSLILGTRHDHSRKFFRFAAVWFSIFYHPEFFSNSEIPWAPSDATTRACLPRDKVPHCQAQSISQALPEPLIEEALMGGEVSLDGSFAFFSQDQHIERSGQHTCGLFWF